MMVAVPVHNITKVLMLSWSVVVCDVSLCGRTTKRRRLRRVLYTWQAPVVTSWWRHSVATRWLVSRAIGQRLRQRVRGCDWLCSCLVLRRVSTTASVSTSLKTPSVRLRFHVVYQSFQQVGVDNVFVLQSGPKNEPIFWLLWC